MAEAIDPASGKAPGNEQVRPQLDRILASEPFVRAERISRFLRYTVEQSLAGRRDGIKESVIGVAVYDRGTDYDPKSDPIVRNEARRLRGKLAEYYEGLGRADSVLIEYPKGGYAPVFRLRLAEPVRRTVGWGKYAAVLSVALALAIAARQWTKGHNSVRPITVKATRIVVLPFVNLSSGQETEYFSDGLTEELRHVLTRSGGFEVLSQTSSFALKGKQRTIREIGALLNVGSVLEGSVRRSGDQVRITAHLIDVADDHHLWSQEYDRDMKDVFAIQDEISTAIAKALQVSLAAGKRRDLDLHPTRDLEAFNLYLQGRHASSRLRIPDERKAAAYFEEAVQRDPHYVQAWAALAEAYCMLGFRSATPPEESFPKCKAAAMKALELDDANAEAHLAWASFKRAFEHDWSGAEREAKRALELNPYYAGAYLHYAEILSETGRAQEAFAPLRRAQELDPLYVAYTVRTAWNHYLLRQPDRALEQCRKAMEIDPNFRDANWMFARAYSEKRMFREAIAAAERDLASNPSTPQVAALLAYYHADGGHMERAREILDRVLAQKNPPPFAVARVYTILGERDQAFAWLEKAYQQHAYMNILKVEPAWDPLHSDPRYTAMLRKLGLADEN